MRRLTPVLFLVLSMPALVSAARSGVLCSIQSDESPYFSKFGDQVLRRSQVIVQGRVDSVSAVPRGDLVRIAVTRLCKGPEEYQEVVLVLANRGDFFAGSELLMFLEAFHGGPRFTCFNHIPLADADFDAKQTHLERQLLLEELPEEEDRRNLARDLLFENARSEVTWSRRNSLRELAYVLTQYPDLIRDQDAEALRAIAEESKDEVFQKELLALLKTRDA